jgi:hypothetical protein
MYNNGVKKFDTFRGDTESLSFNASAIKFQESDNKTKEEIMFSAQTATQSQRKYQDSMKGNPNSRVKLKTHKSFKFQIEEDKAIEAHVTHWQGPENQVQHWQERTAQIHPVCEGSESEKEDDFQFLLWREGEIKTARFSQVRIGNRSVMERLRIYSRRH